MWSVYLLIFLMLCIGFAGWLLFLWAVKSGQYDDLEGPKYRMLEDEDKNEPKRELGKATQAPGTGSGKEKEKL